MQVIGIGVDLVDVPRLGETLRRHSDRFVNRIYTEAEADYCRRGGRPLERFAARFAAKEAVMKALGTGWEKGVGFRDIEVVRGSSGQPGIRLQGEARRQAESIGVRRIDLSLSHTSAGAVAMVILQGEEAT